MVVCFQCSQETKQLLDSILQAGGYKDYGEVIATAIDNLSILQGEVARTGAIVIGNNPATAAHLGREQLIVLAEHPAVQGDGVAGSPDVVGKRRWSCGWFREAVAHEPLRYTLC